MIKPEQNSLLGMSFQELRGLVESLGEAPFRADQLFQSVYSQRLGDVSEFSTLSKSLRSSLLKHGLLVGVPKIGDRFRSSDGTVRYLMTLQDGERVETVWMPDGDDGEAGDGSSAGDPERQDGAVKAYGRATICISSQVGCAVNCGFCLTALLGLQRNLTAGEIVGQVIAVLNDHSVDLDRERINLVFMGQGEPLLNFPNFIKAVRLLKEGVGISESRMTVSTSGIVPRIHDLGQEEVRPKLAISLNAPDDKIREGIMPLNRKWNIQAILEAAKAFPLRAREKLTFEYVLLKNVNDQPQHADKVANLVRDIRCKVNLIAWNPGPEVPYEMPSPESVLSFQSALIRRGIPAFIRRPRGRDIYAACGQLKRSVI